jgi:hypothetical protein
MAKATAACEACELVAEWDEIFDPRMTEILDAIGIADEDPKFDRIFHVVHDIVYDWACVKLGFPGAPHCRAHGVPIPESENCADCAALSDMPFRPARAGSHEGSPIAPARVDLNTT